MFLSPGVTPWKTTLPGVKDGANNPGIRIFEYDTQTLLVKVSQQRALYSPKKFDYFFWVAVEGSGGKKSRPESTSYFFFFF